MRSRFPKWSVLASRPQRWLVLALALAGGFALGAFIAELSRPSYSPSTEMAPARPDPQAPAGTMPPPPGHAVPLPAPPATIGAPNPPAGRAEQIPPAGMAGPPSGAGSPPQTATLPSGSGAPRIVEQPPSPSLVQPSMIPPSVVRPSSDQPAWRRHAVAAPDTAGKAMIAIVIDDMGVDQRRSAEVLKLPAPLTLAFLPYARDLSRQTAAAHQNGHELMVHVSMQPQGAGNNPGPNPLMTDLSPGEIKRRLDWALAAFDGYVGINNHMGSRFTSDRAGMDVVMADLKARGLLFLDSRTVQHSVGAEAAAAHNVPHAARHVFLDNELSANEVTHQLAETERIARQAGLAIAIGHPHDVTTAALKAWLPTLEGKGFVLVPVSAIVDRLEARRHGSQATVGP